VTAAARRTRPTTPQPSRGTSPDRFVEAGTGEGNASGEPWQSSSVPLGAAATYCPTASPVWMTSQVRRPRCFERRIQAPTLRSVSFVAMSPISAATQRYAGCPAREAGCHTFDTRARPWRRLRHPPMLRQGASGRNPSPRIGHRICLQRSHRSHFADAYEPSATEADVPRRVSCRYERI
jgi:hypothetical protein